MSWRLRAGTESGLTTRIIKSVGHSFVVDLSELFADVSAKLGRGHALARFFPYSELKHTWRREPGVVRFKISDYLESAPDEVLESLAWYLVSKANCVKCPDDLSRRYLAHIRSKGFWQAIRPRYLSRARTLMLQPKGRCRDLRTVFDYVNSTYFRGRLGNPTLAWVEESPSRRLGYFFEQLDLLAVNRALDAERVPRYVLEYVVYHELLHYIDAESGRRSRRVHHTKDFRRQEREFSSHADAERWLSRLVAESRRKKR